MRCNDSRLQEFLLMDEATSEYCAVATHIDGCHRCQKRLMELSSDVDFLSEVRDSLLALDGDEPYRGAISSAVSICVESGGIDESMGECEPVSLDFLGAPSHPEMLGRIGRYEVERMIGSGGMGIVLKGFDTELHRVVAIKVLKPHLAHVGAARHRFAREAQSAAAVVHDHVVPIYDVQSDGELPYLVMQFVPGQSLQTRVDERGPLPPREILRIGMQAAAGLAAAHQQGLVHRDVKPANILLEESVERVLISDFGLARTVDDATLTRTGIVAGTPHYMSPEQASGQPVDHRSDLFSLGSAIYFMCTGRPPYRAEHALAVLNRICHDPHRPVDEINDEIPAELAEAVDRLLSKRPADRFKDAHEVELWLGTILAQLQKGRRSRRLRWRRRWLRWKPVVQKSFAALSVVTVCVLIGMWLPRWFAGPSGNDSGDERGQKLAQSGGVRPSRLNVRNGTESNAKPQGVAASMGNQIPRSINRNAERQDEFSSELVDLLSTVTSMEPDSRVATERDSGVGASNDSWRLELHQVEATIESLERGMATQSPSFDYPQVLNERSE